MMLMAAIGLHHYKPDQVVQIRHRFFGSLAPRGNTENSNLFIEEIRYIPRRTVQTWKERDYLIVFGVPSMDVTAQMKRRLLQRTTCWQFPGVATRSNNFTGSMLVLYVLAR
ncbi:putative UDP-Gal or UDP-GlcNAc-dependent glycosyltransferase, partial [Trypanosoma theileri]